MFLRTVVALAFGAAALASSGLAVAQSRAICYNCPPEWADWGSQLKAIQAQPRHRRPARQQELRPDPLGADRREVQAGGGRRLSRRHVRRAGARRRGARAAPAEGLGEDPRRPQGPRRLLVHDPRRHARPLREHRGAQGQARPAELDRSAQARLPGHGRLSRSDQRGRRPGRRDGGESRARRHLREHRPGDQVLQGAAEEPADRAEADLVRARDLRRDPDPLRLRLQRLSRPVHRQGAGRGS